MKKIIKIIIIFILCICIGIGIYLNDYYHADSIAIESLKSDEVIITKTDYGYYFDGYGKNSSCIFYPGGKVEDISYAPLCHELARQGIDVCLVHMPFNLAVFDKNKADDVIKEYDYQHWYIAGHSLGGAMASDYVSNHDLDALILLGSYTNSDVHDTKTLFIYGSEDHVINREKYDNSKENCINSIEYIVKGGNHAQFGSYGIQSGDGTPTISQDKQIKETIQFIINHVER